MTKYCKISPERLLSVVVSVVVKSPRLIPPGEEARVSCVDEKAEEGSQDDDEVVAVVGHRDVGGGRGGEGLADAGLCVTVRSTCGNTNNVTWALAQSSNYHNLYVSSVVCGATYHGNTISSCALWYGQPSCLW